MVANCCNPSALKAEAGESPQLQGLPGLQSEFQDGLAYRVRPLPQKMNRLFNLFN